MDPQLYAFLMANPQLQAQLQGMAGSGMQAQAAPGQTDVDMLLDRLSGGMQPMQPASQPGVPQLPPTTPMPQPAGAPVDQAQPAAGGMSPQVKAQLAAQLPGFTGALGGRIGRLIDTVSDRRAKTAITDDRDAIDQLLDALSERHG